MSAFASLGLAVLVVGKWDELSAGITGAPALVVVAAVALQALALVSRSAAWYVCVRASGGTVGRRRLYRASSMGFVGGLVNGQLSSAARIAALRRSAPEASPRVSALIAAELPILVVEAMLAGDGLPPANYLMMGKVTMEKGNPSTTTRRVRPWSATSSPAMRPGARHASSSRGRGS